MNSVEGVSDLHMSGARAVFDLRGDAEKIEAQLAAAFAQRGMKLERFERETRPRRVTLYRADSEIT